jgi:putative ABC transport system substrate-binding protein
MRQQAIVRTKTMKTISFLSLCALLALCLPAAAQQQVKIPRLGYLTGGDSSPNEAFVQGLRDLGYFEGKNIVIEVRNADGKMDRLPDLAAELVRLGVNVIVAVGGQGALPAKHATSIIPIVFTLVSDPVGAGLVTSLAPSWRESYGAKLRLDRLERKTA